jgi:2-dehydropantoate 2-reductase
MQIAVMGAGGMGGYLGAKLALAGHDVGFVARGAHLHAMCASGLTVSGAESLHLQPVLAAPDPAALARQLDDVALVLFCVKLYDTEPAAAALAPLIGEKTVLLTVQNGIESARRLAAAVGPGRTLAGCAYFPSNIEAPGEIRFMGAIEGQPLLRFGEAGAGASRRAEAIAQTFVDAGVPAEVCEDADVMLWQKFCLMAGVSASTTLTRQNVGPVRDDPDMRWLLSEAIDEAARVGRAQGVALPPDLTAHLLRVIDGNPADGRASTLVDLERGRRLELEGLSGAVVRLGREAGVPTPVHATVYAALKPFVNGREGAAA